jgi:hypothetical protein
MPGGLFLGVSIIALALFISLLHWGIRNSRQAPAPINGTGRPLPTGENHHWVQHYEYKLSDFLPAPSMPTLDSAEKSVTKEALKNTRAGAVTGSAADEMEQLAQAELAAEAVHYAARAEAEEQVPQPIPAATAASAETYDNPFDEPAPTATDKHNTTVKNQLRAKRAAAARNSRLAVASDALTKSCPA